MKKFRRVGLTSAAAVCMLGGMIGCSGTVADVPLEDKVVFFVTETAGGTVESPALRVTVQCKDKTSWKHGMDSAEEAKLRREEAFAYYATANSKVCAELGFGDAVRTVCGMYSPVVEFYYKDYDSFMARDYASLKGKESDSVLYIYVEACETQLDPFTAEIVF